MANISKIYSDIDFTFTKRPVVGDIAVSYDSQAVIRSIRNLLSTNNYDRLFNPDIGSGLNAILFEDFSQSTSSMLEKLVEITIKNYEPRVNLQNIKVTANIDKNAYDVSLTFYIENATTATSITLLLERNR
jgi:phage baseplate assembly protein W